MAVHLVCEGPRQGLDERLLNAVVIQYHNLAVLTSPSGGSKGLGAVRAYLTSRSAHDVAVAVEDRDYRPLAVANGTWANQAGRSFIWRRHEIENYLLHPQVVLALFNELRPLPGSHWAIGLPASEPDVDALLQALAAPLLADHAAGVLRDEILEQMNAVGSVSFSLARPLPPAGAPPRDSPSGWRRSVRRRPDSPRHVRRLPAYSLFRTLRLRRGTTRWWRSISSRPS